MPLHFTLKPQEWFMVDDTRVVNIWDQTAKFKIEGAAAILRQAQVMTAQDADTPTKKAYLSVQHLYLGITKDPTEYLHCAEALLAEHPSAAEAVSVANGEIAKGSYYGALREYWKLVKAAATASPSRDTHVEQR